jgi:PKD domain-containing protein
MLSSKRDVQPATRLTGRALFESTSPVRRFHTSSPLRRRWRSNWLRVVLVIALCLTVAAVGTRATGSQENDRVSAPRMSTDHDSGSDIRLVNDAERLPSSPVDSHQATNPLDRGWLLWNNSTNPPARYWAAMSDDPAEGGVLLFGGIDAANVALNDTWLFHAGQWTELCSGGSTPPVCASSPPARYSMTMTYDAEDHGVILYGGTFQSTTYEDTWVFHDGSWENETASVNPGADPGPMVYDAADGYVLMFSPLGSSWAFSNGTWARLSPTTSPSGRGGAAMFYDAEIGMVILRGGYAGGNQTWEYHADNWTLLSPQTSPPSGAPLGWAYDSAFGYGVVLDPSGQYGEGLGPNTTWIFQNNTWANVSSQWSVEGAPPTSTFLSMAYDSTDEYSVALVEVGSRSDLNETWILRDPLTLNATASAAVRDVGENITYNIRVAGGIDPYNATFGTPPPGCSPPTNVTSSIEFSCKLVGVGSFNLAVSVADAIGDSINETIPLKVSAAPTVGVVVGPNPTTIGIPVRLDATVEGGTSPLSYSWRIGAARPINESGANWTFSAVGSYLATFQVTDVTGSTVSANATILVNPSIAIAANVSDNVTDVGLPVDFAVAASGGTEPLAFAWIFGDGSGSSQSEARHNYSSAGHFDPEVWVNDSVGAGASENLSIQVNPPLAINATSNPTTAVENSPVEFMAIATGGSAPFSYVWRFDDGEVNNSANAVQTFDTVGTHTATLMVNDSVGGSRTKVVSIVIVAPRSISAPPVSNSSRSGPPLVDLVAAGAAVLVLVVLVVVLVRRRKRRPADGDSAG